MSVVEASDLLGVDVNRIQVMAAQGELPSRRVGRATMFDPDEIAQHVGELTRPSWSTSVDRQSADS